MRHPSRYVTIALVTATAAVALLAGIALAQTPTDKLRSGNEITIPAGETIAHDLYAFGGAVRIAGTVDGDLVASGGIVDVSGTVTGDVLAAGGTVSVGGTVGGDVRVAGGTVSISGSVTEDLLVTGGQVSLSPSGSVGEDVIAGTGQLAIDGTVTGDLMASTGSYGKSGTIGGTEDVRISTAPAGPAPAEPTVTGRGIDAFEHFIVVLVSGAIMLWLAPRLYAASKAAVQRRPLPAAGWGVLGLLGYVGLLIVIVLAMIVLAIVFGLVGLDDLVGLDLLGGMTAILGVTFAFVVVSGYLADAIVGAALAGLLLREPAPTRGREFAVLAAGAAVVVLVSSIPIVGPLVKLVVVVLGLGAVLLSFVEARRSQQRIAGITEQPAPVA
jgi:cytoskeletal protein CcmA (bactofilin family)